VTASAGAAHWTSAIGNLSADQHASSTASAAGAAGASAASAAGSHGLTQALDTVALHLDAYFPAPHIGIAGTLEVGAAPAHGSTTAFGNIATAQQPADVTDSSVTTLQAPWAPVHAAPAQAAPAHQAHVTAAPGRHAAPAPVHAAPAHAAAAHAAPAPAHAAAVRQARHAAPAHTAQAQAAPARPYLIYDSVSPSAIPAGQQVATYADGNYAASPSSIAGRGNVLWIDTNGSDPAANALDVEPGDATPAGAAMWVGAKLNANHAATAIVYTMISDWQSVKDDIAGLPGWMQSHVRYWIADPTGVPHVVPGSNATQWYWGANYDITTANPGFQG
jgi:hypothetical protein